MDDEVARVVKRILKENQRLAQILPSTAVAIGVPHEDARWRRRSRPMEEEEEEEELPLARIPESQPEFASTGPEMPSNLGKRKRGTVERMVNLKEYDCRICLSPMTRTQVSILVPCMHRFCFSCLRKWFKGNSTHCPLCKVSGEVILYHIFSERDYKLKILTSAPRTTESHLEWDPAPEDPIKPAPLGHHDTGHGDSSAGASSPSSTTQAIKVWFSLDGHIWTTVEQSNITRHRLGLPPLRVREGETCQHRILTKHLQVPSFELYVRPDGETSMSISESNRLRAALGLRPLQRGALRSTKGCLGV